MRIKAVVESFVRELKSALEADIQDRIMKEREMNSYLDEREREVAERERGRGRQSLLEEKYAILHHLPLHSSTSY